MCGIVNGGRAGIRAFTLIELMVVIVIVGIMTALIIPEMRGTFQDALLRASGRKLIEAFNLANSRAVALNQTQKVRLDRRTGRYEIESASSASGKPKQEVPGGEGTLDQRITLDWKKGEATQSDEPGAADEEEKPSDRDIISFFADGTADSAQIILKDQGGFTLTFRLNPVTARLEMVESESK